MRKRSLLVTLMAGLLLPPTSAAAREDDVQLWSVVTLDHGLTENWGAHLQFRTRIDEDVTHFKDWLVRPYVTWNVWRGFHADIGYDHLGSNDGSNENRVWLTGEHVLPWRELELKNRLRFDNRWVEDVDGVVVRFRYRLRGTHPIPGTKGYLAVSDEVFANLNDRGAGPADGFEQNRLRVAVGGRLFSRLRGETGYEWQVIDLRAGGLQNRHVFFFQLVIDTGKIRDERLQ